MSQLLNLKNYLVIITGCLLLGFQTSGFADDSTKVAPIIQTTPTILCSGGAFHYSGSPSACFTTLGDRFPWPDWLDATTYPPATPFQTTNILGATYQSVQVEGDYLVVATFEFQSFYNQLSYYWVDDWATGDVDYNSSAIPQNHRIFYSGDNPMVLNVGISGVKTAYYTGTVHLHAGAKIYYPEIWLGCLNGNCGAMTINNDAHCAAGSCNCATGNFVNGGTCFYVTLLRSP